MNKSKLKFLKDTDVNQESVQFLFAPYLARNEVTILSSDPGSGKTYFACWLAACCSQGDFIINQEQNTPGSNRVVFLSKEDKYSTTIIPRYRASGGKEGSLYFLDSNLMPETFADKSIKEIVKIKPDLIIFDAVSSFIGDANINQANEVRKALKPLSEYIQDSGTAVLIIAHNNKMSSSTNALHRVTGSVDFTAFARSGLTIVKKDDVFFLAQFKNNLEALGESLVFELKDTGHLVKGMVFKEFSDLTAEELLGAPVRSKSTLVEEIEDLLISLLKEREGWGLVKELSGTLQKLGYSQSSINRARINANINYIRKWDYLHSRSIGFWAFEGVKIPEKSEDLQLKFSLTANDDKK